MPKAIGGAPKTTGGPSKKPVAPGGAHDVPKTIESGPKPTASVAGDAPAEAERRSKRVTRRPRRPRV